MMRHTKRGNLPSMQNPPASIGCPVADIDTPALIVDLDAFDRNIAKMAAYAARVGVGLRAHAKTHKSSDVARRQMAAGAVGQCVQKVGEAEILARAGIPDILVSNQVVAPPKLDRLAALAREARIGLCFDDPDQVALASAAAVRAGVEFSALVEIDVGMARCGVPPGSAAAELGLRIADTPGLRFEGLQAYQGRAQHLPTAPEREAAIRIAIDAAKATGEALARVGLTANTVSGAGTGTFRLEAESGVYTELQAGSYAFMDGEYAGITDRDGRPYAEFEHSLFVLSGVISVAGGDWFVVDAGLKSYSGERGPPKVHGGDGWDFLGMSDEHGKIGLSGDSRRPRLGDKVALIPGHCDPTINLHEWYVGVRDGRVEEIWAIDARGASR